MHICIEIGNTNAHIGFFEGCDLKELVILPTPDLAHNEKLIFLKKHSVKKVCIASVVKWAQDITVLAVKEILGVTPQVISAQDDFGFVVEYDRTSIGVDRLLGIYAAKNIFKNDNIMVVSFGSAVTINFLIENKFVGGAVLPGIQLMRESFILGLDAVKPKAFEKPEKDIGQNTTQAVNAGIYFGILKFVEHYVKAYQKSHHIKVVATGGDCHIFSSQFSFDAIEPNLVLKGMAGR